LFTGVRGLFHVRLIGISSGEPCLHEKLCGI